MTKTRKKSTAPPIPPDPEPPQETTQKESGHKNQPLRAARPLLMKPCPVSGCNHESPTETAIRGHIKSKHPDVPPYGCSIQDCQNRFATSKGLKEHVNMAHPIPENTDWPCHIKACDEVFGAKWELLAHHTKKHPKENRFECNQRGCETAVSSMEEMDLHLIEQHKDKAVRCRDDSCARILPHIAAEAEHFKIDHLKILFACPVEECGETFISMDKKTKHVKKKHPDIELHECVHHGCTKRFKMRKEMQAHLREEHPRPKFPCSEDGCGLEFGSQKEMMQHVKGDHRHERYVCSFPGCEHWCVTKAGIFQHEKEYHADETLSCTEDGCEATFSHQKALDKHIRLIHNGKKLECPFEDCLFLGGSNSSLTRHIRRFHPGRSYEKTEFPCPLAVQEGCGETFPTSKLASMHLNVAHAGKIPCRYAVQCECNRIFDDTDQEIRHSRTVHTYYMCNVQGCVNTISGRWLTGGAIQHHRRLHEETGKFAADSEFPKPTKIVPGDSEWEAVFKWHKGSDRQEAQASLLNGIESATESANRNDVIEVGTASDDTATEDDGTVADDSIAETSEEGAFELVVAGSNLKFAEEQAASVRRRNIKILLICPKSNHSTFGLRCVGPDPVIDFLARARRCPTRAVLNYDTANLIRQIASSESTRLSRRCVRCDAEFTFYTQLKKYELLAEDGVKVCSMEDCVKSIFHGSRLCEQHLYEFQPEHACAGASMRDELERLLARAMDKKWYPQSKMQSILRLFNSIRDGDIDSSKLRFLDLEFNPTSRRVYEVGMCDANGIITMDCLTKYSATPEVVASSVPDKARDWIDRSIQQSVQKHRCAHGWITARQVADKLRKEGVTPDTWFVTWHMSTADLTALREWLEAEGEHGVLPPDDHCVTAIQQFRANLTAFRLQTGKLFPLSLPVLFPLVMGTQHHLFGRNHHAAVDAQQLYHMVEMFAILCKPKSDRPEGWLERLRNSSDRQGYRQPTVEQFLEVTKGKGKRYPDPIEGPRSKKGRSCFGS